MRLLLKNTKNILFEEYLANYCWKRDQSNTLPINRKESKAISTIVEPLYARITGSNEFLGVISADHRAAA
ncbi:hypothetical protein CEQ20_17160 [Yersinia pseudotuberculosis]|nr:hypothetical protein CEQ20_17160 [Yersinia pseudotuberculosis]AYX10600.1 hypothetical protein EGX52_07220 [Yersinia pseudotuberculosis]MBO1565487.1 hypothetical protein [Yersinia pseudotuberculosis]MBO1589620.1 hypothetical protein [Yersinia pseudotuberculosis]MBO1602449.1 hypothetical protein [Yersinia pseudotuberculosis]